MKHFGLCDQPSPPAGETRRRSLINLYVVPVALEQDARKQSGKRTSNDPHSEFLHITLLLVVDSNRAVHTKFNELNERRIGGDQTPNRLIAGEQRLDTGGCAFRQSVLTASY
jgi:hypothetical protein